MKIIQTCWFDDKDKFDGGWLSTQYHLMSWCLSAVTYKKFYPEVVLNTNVLGKEILLDQLGLPYSDFSLDQEYFQLSKEKHW